MHWKTDGKKLYIYNGWSYWDQAAGSFKCVYPKYNKRCNFEAQILIPMLAFVWKLFYWTPECLAQKFSRLGYVRQERCLFLFFNSNVNRFSSGLEACLQFKGLLDRFSFRRKLCDQMLSSDRKRVVADGKFLLLGEKPPDSLSMTCLDLKQLPSSDFC